MRQTILIGFVIILASCSGESGKTATGQTGTAPLCDALVDSLKLVIANRNDSILKLTQIIDNQADSILKLNGGVKADDYEVNTFPKDSTIEK